MDAVIKIHVENSKCKMIGPFPRKTIKELCSFSYENASFMKYQINKKQNRKVQWDGKRKLFSDVTDTFPTGLLPKIISTLGAKGIRFEIVDDRDIEYACSFKGDNRLRPYQNDIVKKALSTCVCGIPFPRNILKYETGAGKTIMVSVIISHLLSKGLGKVLFIIDSVDLLMQTKESFEKFLPGIKIGIFGGGEKNLDGQVIISTVQSLYYYLSKPSKKMISKNPNIMDAINKYNKPVRDLLLKAKTLIIDEVHDFKSNNRYKLFMKSSAYARFYLSATPFKKRETPKNEDLLIIASCGELLSEVDVPSASREVLVEEGYLTKMSVRLLKLPSGSGDDSSYPEAIRKFIEGDNKFHEYVMHIAEKMLRIGRKPLILVTRRIQGSELFSLLTLNQVPCTYIHGGTDRGERVKAKGNFIKGNNVLIATKIYDKGIDIPEIDAIILAGPVKVFHRIKQRVGRGVRANQGKQDCIIIDFIDYRNRYLLAHSRERIKYYRGEAQTEIKVHDVEKYIMGGRKDVNRLDVSRDSKGLFS